MFTTPENQNKGLHITYKGGDIIENLARFQPAHWLAQTLLLGTPRGIFGGPSEKMAEELNEMYKDVEFKGQYEVLLGGNSLMTQLNRLFSPDRRMNIFSRLITGLPATITGWAITKLNRADHYNPYTETAVIYNPNIAVAAHEIGHAEFFDKQLFPALTAPLYALPIIRSNMEWKASRNAMSHFNEEQDREKANLVLSGAFGTYYAVDLLQLIGPALAVLPPPIAAGLGTTAIIGGAIGGRVHAALNNIFRGGKNIFNKRQLEQVQAV